MNSKTASASNNKRLAKNTIVLYLRTFLVMGVSLYTSRIVIATLGINDYGIYHLVGGFVSMFAIVGGTLVSATQRFFSYELGKKEQSDIGKVFSSALILHFILAFILLILFETFGLWFLNVKLNIPLDRLYATNWVYQCSVLVFLVNIISSPYNALIIAYEKMSAFAYISLLDVSLKLLAVYLLYLSTIDKLIVYSILLLLISVGIRFCYSFYCRRHFPQASFKFVRGIDVYKSIAGFASMTFVGSVASILANQGINIILNIFCGVAVNAARGIATQIEHAVTKFTSDFMTALNPQITKTYAAGLTRESMMLCYRGAKLSFYLLLIIATPIFFKTECILKLWLTVYPEYTVFFVRLTLIYSLLMVLSKPLITEILAIGRLERFVLWIGGIRLIIIPSCYIVMSMGFRPFYCYYVLIFFEIISLFVRLNVIKNLTNVSMFYFFKEVLLYVFLVLIVIFGFSYAINSCFHDNTVGLLLFSVLSIIFSLISIVFIGLTRKERGMIIFLIQKRIRN